MRVVEVATQANPQRVIEAYLAAYGKTHGLTPQRVQDWAGLLAGMVGVRGAMRVVISHHADPDPENSYYDVSGAEQGEEPRYALDFTDWEQWREMEVEDRTGQQLGVDQLAAHLLFEMSWHGWPSAMQAKRDELTDAVEQLDRDLAGRKPGDPLPPGYVELGNLSDEEVLKRLRGPDSSGE